jgi:ribonuclease Z
MKVKILGSGSALPDPVRGNPSQAVLVDDEVLLFDCGERTTVNLVSAGVNPMDIDHLFLTHLHWDHIVDLNYLLMTVWYCGRSEALNVYGPPGTRDMTEAMLEAHAMDLRSRKALNDSLVNPQVGECFQPGPVLNVKGLESGVVLDTENYTVKAGLVRHIDLLGFHRSSWGFRVESEYGTVALSGDTEPCQEIVDLAQGADLLIYECTFLDDTLASREMRGHSGPSGAGRVAHAAGVKRLVLNHLGPFDSSPAAVEMASMYYGKRRGPEVWSEIIRETARFYDGPIVLGEDTMEIAVGAS